MNVLDLFSGIGGLSLGLERTGMRTIAFCEIEPFCRAVLRKHWPNVPQYDDVRTLTAERLKQDGIGPVDLICGGFPCQDISVAGRGAGITGSRSGLWSEFSRLIGEIRPRYAIVENVAALLGRGMGVVLGDLVEIGYDAEWHCIPASYVGAPHRRDRIWIISYPNGSNATGIRESLVENAHPYEWTPTETVEEWNGWLDELVSGNVAQRADSYAQALRILDAIPNRLDRLASLGNAVVPQIPEIIGRAILEAEKNRLTVERM